MTPGPITPAQASAGKGRLRSRRLAAAFVAAGLVAVTSTAISHAQPDYDGSCLSLAEDPSWPPQGDASWPPEGDVSWRPTDDNCVTTSTSPSPTPSVPLPGMLCLPGAICPAS